MSKILFEVTGSGMDISGTVTGTRKELIDFFTGVMLGAMKHAYDTHSIYCEETALFITIQTVKEAFDLFMEEHEGETEGAFAMCRDFEKFREEMEG